MKSMNRVQLIGNLGADPEVRRTQNGDAVATLSIATTERWTDKQTGKENESTEWHRCVLWRQLAEISEKHLRKGARVFVEGKLKTRKWQDQQGQDRYTTEIQVRDMIMFGDGVAAKETVDARGGVSGMKHHAYVDKFDDEIPF